MIFYTYNNDFIFTGLTEVEPTHSNWTLVPYIDSFNEPKFNVETQLWYESKVFSEQELQDEAIKQVQQFLNAKEQDGITYYKSIDLRVTMALMRMVEVIASQTKGL